MLPRSGDVLHVTRAASVQFVEPMLFRVIRVIDRITYVGWVWLDGYELNAAGDAVERREIFVQPAGLRLVPAERDPARVRRARLAHNGGSRAASQPSDRRVASPRGAGLGPR